MKKIEIATPNLNGKLATEVFSRCPRCRNQDLVHFEGDVICTACSWDSIEISVESQLSAHCSRFKEARMAEDQVEHAFNADNVA